MSSNPMECIYLIGSEANALVKIGRTVDVRVRFAEIQRMSPVKLTLLWQTKGGRELEDALHRHFKACRSHGEWFDFPDGDAVAQVTQALPEIAQLQAARVAQALQRAGERSAPRREKKQPFYGWCEPWDR